MTAWTFRFPPVFIDELRRHSNQITAAERQVSRAQYPQIRMREQALADFLDAIKAVRNAEFPPALLKPVKSESGRFLASIFVLEVEPYRAYYHVDVARQFCIGLYVADGPLTHADIARLVAPRNKRDKHR